MHQIIPRLWVGNVDDALNTALLKRHGINAIMNCTRDVEFAKCAKTMHRARVSVDDDLTKKQIMLMSAELPNIVKWIDDMMKAKRHVLVHCMAGQQRSCCAVAAYLMSKRPEMSVQDVVQFVRSKRTVAFRPFANFRPALNRYKTKLDRAQAR